ncbi:MAG TPA: CAP domain-containing protein, partial [Spirochaetia bacterium]|nr:CAP domain-containing protein [Spirochaetia bacterium]
ERIDFAAVDYPRLDAVIFYATNEIRRKHDLSFLPYRPELERAAFHHAKRMVEKRFFSHTDSTAANRRSPNDRGKLAGIANPFLAENIAESFGIAYTGGRSVYPRGEPGAFSYTAQGALIPPHTYLSFADDLLELWMNSSGHRANILSSNALFLGCGAYYYTDSSFFGMPKFKAVQNFQWFKEIEEGPVTDPLP